MAPTQKFTNSGLVSYTKLSKNNSGLRKYNICGVAIHAVAASCTVEGLGACFSHPQCEASSNYGIDNNGRIGMYVEEKNRSWCTSSGEVDNRVVTIEVSNTATGEPWPISDKAYNAIIDLCVDICQRNNIPSLKWKADKNLLGKWDQQNIVAHRWTAKTGKSCLPVNTEVQLLRKDNIVEWVPISKIKIGDTILARNEDGSDSDYNEVYDIVEPYEDTVYTFSSGLRATGNHRLLVKRSPTEDNWITLTIDEILDEVDKIGTSFYVPNAYNEAVPLGNITSTSCEQVTCVSVKLGYIIIKQGSYDQRFWVGNCPGNYIYERLGDIANKVNARLKSNSQVISSSTVNAIKESPEKFIWSYLYSKTYNKYVVSAIMGCMQAESGFISNNLENTKEKLLGMNDEQYTTAVDKGAYPNFASDKCGYGLCQWTYDLGKKRLLDFAKQRKKSVADLYTQLEFFWWDLNTNFKTLKATLDTAKTIPDALRPFLNKYEYGGQAPDSIYNKRLSHANEIYKRNAPTTTQTTTTTTQQNTTAKKITPIATATRKLPYAIRVEVDELRIRKEPNTSSGIKGSIKDRGAYTIIAESKGNGAKLWGKLKSGAGWIALDYTSFIKNL